MFLCALACVSAYASASLATYQAAAFPQASMQSTSALLRVSAPQMTYKQGTIQRPAVTTPVGRAMHATSAVQVQTIGMASGVSVAAFSSNIDKKRTYSASQSSTACMNSITLPARAITQKNLAFLESEVGGDDDTWSLNNSSRPRRINGEDDDDDPSNPYIDGNHTPVGDLPFVLLAGMILLYVLHKMSSKRKLYFTKCK